MVAILIISMLIFSFTLKVLSIGKKDDEEMQIL